jgi:hypothetical protein
MELNSILAEVWRIKDEMSREAGYDLHRLCESTRQWAAKHPPPGPLVGNASELRRMAAEYERQHPSSSVAALNETPPPKQ